MSKKDRPITIKGSVKRILSGMSDADKQAIAKMKKGELIKLHMSLGMTIRNELGLWQGNTIISDSGLPCHPDDVSGEIVEAVWLELRKR